jgi:MFS superfamily sulfate permease-like transporter
LEVNLHLVLVLLMLINLQRRVNRFPVIIMAVVLFMLVMALVVVEALLNILMLPLCRGHNPTQLVLVPLEI